MFDPRFHNVDQLLKGIRPDILPFDRLNGIATTIQRGITASGRLQDYALDLWEATRNPGQYGVSIDEIDMDRLVFSGASARGMSMLMRAARVAAWLNNRNAIIPEDIQTIFHETVAHRIFLFPTYEMRRESLITPLVRGILQSVASP